ncbi:cellulose synthase operon protein YhjQ [Pseudomonas kairouanensis]|uniref:Cellulose synthase operon protein YhjQ n=1 Tax=Pseudomonas kairouanensis TaxID=2293832 RepID=A0A4Z0ADR8_9PSED|nr:cellulose biosynthesis protein BcsQ [Pseudomonas kairouanensis]TFY84138.1 cellulose synthase operon protein YhjQ [Pseudomonas kairouanensis]
MSRTDDLFALFGKGVSRDPKGRNARLHFFGTIPFDDGTRVNMKDGSRFSANAPYPNEQSQPYDANAPRPTVVAVVSINGGVGRSTLVTALSSGLQRLGEPVVALDLDPQNALRQHFGVDQQLLGIGRGSLINVKWETLLQPGFAGCQVMPFGDIDIQQQENLQRWMSREPHWLAQHLRALGLSERHTVIIDTPAGNNVYLHQALNLADHVLVVVQSDAACLGTLDQMEALLAPYLARERAPRCHFVINQLDEHSAFSLDMVDAFKQRLSENLLEIVHRDPSISEALAFSTDPLDNLAASSANDDINELCRLLRAARSVRVAAAL